jgi:hypothetical protein
LAWIHYAKTKVGEIRAVLHNGCYCSISHLPAKVENIVESSTSIRDSNKPCFSHPVDNFLIKGIGREDTELLKQWTVGSNSLQPFVPHSVQDLH